MNSIELLKEKIKTTNKEVLDIIDINETNIQIVVYEQYFDGKYETLYNPCINYKPLIFVFHDMESAIVKAIAYKYDGINSNADTYFWKMIK